PIVLVTDPGHEEEARIRLARIGFDTVLGVLDQPRLTFLNHPEVVRTASRLTAGQVAERRNSLSGLQLVDVRGPGEVESGMIPTATHVPLPELLDLLDGLDPQAPTVVYCAGGYRSSIAASTLRSHGFTDVSDLLGGYAAWAAIAASEDDR
ncbi:MAG: rhodanese-like domain-containing protein, partial [Ilumatobacteraceae bacterium]